MGSNNNDDDDDDAEPLGDLEDRELKELPPPVRVTNDDDGYDEGCSGGIATTTRERQQR